MDFETIAALVSFAALIIVWAFAPTQGKEAEAPAKVAAPREAVA
jgi:hypothetical protein